jgi:Ca2+-transporting ATPase
MTPPPHAAGESQGLQSTLGLGGGGSGVGLPDTFKSSEGEYRTSTEDRERIFGQDNLPQRPRERFLHLTWPALKDAVLVSSSDLPFFPALEPDVRLRQILLSIYATVSLAFSFFQDFGTTRPPRIPG